MLKETNLNACVLIRTTSPRTADATISFMGSVSLLQHESVARLLARNFVDKHRVLCILAHLRDAEVVLLAYNVSVRPPTYARSQILASNNTPTVFI